MTEHEGFELDLSSAPSSALSSSRTMEHSESSTLSAQSTRQVSEDLCCCLGLFSATVTKYHQLMYYKQWKLFVLIWEAGNPRWRSCSRWGSSGCIGLWHREGQDRGKMGTSPRSHPLLLSGLQLNLNMNVRADIKAYQMSTFLDEQMKRFLPWLRLWGSAWPAHPPTLQSQSIKEHLPGTGNELCAWDTPRNKGQMAFGQELASK